MPIRNETSLVRPGTFRDPFAVLRQMTNDFDRFWHVPFGAFAPQESVEWSPMIDVFEKDKRLVTRVDLPGLKKEDVKVEVADGQLTISGERKREFEERKENTYRREREFGSFFRTVPLPDGVKVDDVQATFTDGVLEVSIPLPSQKRAAPKTVEIH